MIKKFEELIGKKIEDIEIDDILRMTSNEEIVILLSENSETIVDEILNRNSNVEVIQQFLPVKIHQTLYQSEKKIGEMFQNENREELIQNVKNSIFTFNTSLFDIPLTLVSLIAFDPKTELDMSIYKSQIKDSIKEFFNEYMKLMPPIDTYPLLCEMLDLLYSVREEYHRLFNEDITEDVAEELQKFIKEIDAAVAPIFDEKLQNVVESLGEEDTPEKYGYLDITKLRKEE